VSGLSRERAIAAALEIVDRDGLDALTMRALGRALGADPMAVYHHVPSKAALLDGVVEAVLGEIPLDAAPERPPAERIKALARGYRAALRAHPNALPAVATRPDVSPVALRLVDTALGILLEAGYSPADALTLFHATSCFVVGHALDESGSAQPVAAEGYTNLAAVAAAAPRVTPDATFEAGLAALLDSVADRR
jgi:TetR/AcrR family tetracycline transcriptional repressor